MLHRAAPLIRVEFGGVEKRKIFPATAPFHFIERVHTEVNEERPLKPHPRRLIRARRKPASAMGKLLVPGRVFFSSKWVPCQSRFTHGSP
jgi:hypothetical protein